VLLAGGCAAVIVGIFLVPRVRDWRAAGPYRTAAGTMLDRVGVPDIPGAVPAPNAGDWQTCSQPTCAVVARALSLPTQPRLADLQSPVGGWLTTNSIEGMRFGNPFWVGWNPVCHRQQNGNASEITCASSRPLPGKTMRLVLYVSAQYADPGSVQTPQAAGFSPNPTTRFSQLSVAVMAYAPEHH
jgi:hypothetical protein